MVKIAFEFTYNVLIKGAIDYFKNDYLGAIFLNLFAFAMPILAFLKSIFGLDVEGIQTFVMSNFFITMFVSLFVTALEKTPLAEKWKQVVSAIIINTYVLPMLLQKWGIEINSLYVVLGAIMGHYVIMLIIRVGEKGKEDIPNAIIGGIKTMIENFSNRFKSKEQ
jgi:hypothetical protein